MGCATPPARMRAVHGELDLRTAPRDEVVSLDGEWAIYWETLLPPGAPTAPDAYLPIGRWNGQVLFDGRRLPGTGFATYRLLVHLPETPEPRTLVVSPLVEATRI